jgi:tRNA(adenine34) deaminase
MSDDDFMHLALAEARKAADAGEVPVGAVVVRDGQVIASGYNQPIGTHDPSAHAEVVALRAAAQRLGNYRLEDCDLYVTLEPCPMCSGAALHARLRRVVYGAPDPKTGAAGSVVDLFGQGRLNHHTQVQGGVLADACAEVLQAFFRRRRTQHRQQAQPLREDALRTPEACFADLPDHPWTPRYVADLPSLAGLRLHYVDEGPRTAARTWLCLHDVPGWSYDFRHLTPAWLAAGDRVVAPDLIGFGRSDKPKREAAHRFGWHRQVLLELVQRLDLRHIVLVLRGPHATDLGCTLPLAAPERYLGMVMLDDAKPPRGRRATTRRAPRLPKEGPQRAPFPDRGHQAALRAFAAGWPAPEERDTLAERTRTFWSSSPWVARGLVRSLAPGEDEAALADRVRREVEHWCLPHDGEGLPTAGDVAPVPAPPEA